MALPNGKLGLFAFCLIQTGSLLVTQPLNCGHSQIHHICLSENKKVTGLSIWVKTLELMLSGPWAVSQCNDKRTRRNCNFSAQLAYSWSAEESAVQHDYSKDKHGNGAWHRIPPCSSDFLGTSQQSQWRANCQLSLPLFRLAFSQAIKMFLFTSAGPDLCTE